MYVIVLLCVCSFSLTHFLDFAALGKWGHTLFWCVFLSYGRTLNTMQMSTQTKWSHATRQNMELWRGAIEGKRKKEVETDVGWWEEAILIKLQRETDFYNYNYNYLLSVMSISVWYERLRSQLFTINHSHSKDFKSVLSDFCLRAQTWLRLFGWMLWHMCKW